MLFIGGKHSCSLWGGRGQGGQHRLMVAEESTDLLKDSLSVWMSFLPSFLTSFTKGLLAKRTCPVHSPVNWLLGWTEQNEETAALHSWIYCALFLIIVLVFKVHRYVCVCVCVWLLGFWHKSSLHCGWNQSPIKTNTEGDRVWNTYETVFFWAQLDQWCLQWLPGTLQGSIQGSFLTLSGETRNWTWKASEWSAVHMELQYLRSYDRVFSRLGVGGYLCTSQW